MRYGKKLEALRVVANMAAGSLWKKEEHSGPQYVR